MGRECLEDQPAVIQFLQGIHRQGWAGDVSGLISASQ
jgi:hypothetical protein